jgi:O-antigen/teichoic acid export membrane protein
MSEGATGLPPKRLSQKLINNVLYNVLGNVFTTLISLALMPYIVHKLGDYMYGVFSLAMAVVGYFTILDLGFGVAVIKYLAERGAGGDEKRISRTLGTALTANIAAGSAGAIAMFFGAGYIASHFFKTAHHAGMPPAQAITAVKISAVIFLLSMVSALFLAIPQARQRFDLLNWLRVVTKLVQTLGMAAVLALGGTLSQVLYLYAAVTFLSFIYYYHVSRRILPAGCSLLPRFDSGSFKLLLSFGMFTTLSKVADLLAHMLAPLIIGAMLSANWVTYYALPGVLAGMIMLAASIIAPVIFPAASELDSSDARDKLKLLYTRSVKYCYTLTLPLFVVLVAMPHAIMRYWQGEIYARNGAAVLALLSAGGLFEALTTTPAMIIVGVGRPDIQAYFAIGAGVMNTALCFILIPRFGITGAAEAFAITAGVTAFLFFIFVGTKMKYRPVLIVRDSLASPTLAAGLSFASVWLLKAHVTGRLTLVAVAFAGGLVFLAGLVIFRAVGSEELNVLKSYLRK